MSRFRYRFMYSSGCILEMAKVVIGLVIFFVVLHFFVVTILPISGASMEPNFKSGEWILLDKISYFLKEPGRGDAVALRFPGDPKHERYIKRIIGLPGEKIELRSGAIFINGRMFHEAYLPSGQMTEPHSNITNTTLGKDEYYLLGDNRYNSNDSRDWGVAKRGDFIGKARYVIFPFGRVRPAD